MIHWRPVFAGLLALGFTLQGQLAAATKLGALTLTGTGDALELPIGFSSTDGVTALQFDLDYNAALPLGAATLGEAATGHKVDSTLVSTGKRRVVLYSTTLAPLDGGIILRFPSPGAATTAALPGLSNTRLVSTGLATVALSGAPQVPNIAASPVGAFNLAGKAHTLSVTPSGDGPFTYQWLLNGAPIDGATADTYAFTAFTAANNGRYSVSVTGPFGSATSGVARLSAGLPWAEAPAALARKVAGNVSLDLREGLLTSGITWASSKLPAGLKLDAKTGLLTGRITAKPGTYTITLWSVSGKTKGETRTLTLTVEPYPTTLIGAFEGLLTHSGSGLPAGKLTLKVASGGGFTGTLVAPLPKTYALKGNLLVNDAGTAALVTLPVAPYSLAVALATEGTAPLSATLTQGATPRGSLGDGVRLAAFTGKGVGIAPWRAAGYTLALGDPRANLDLTLPSRALPVGAGYATGSVDAKGLLKLTGKLADGRAFTASLSADADAGYRCYVQPYGAKLATAADNYLAGWLRLARWSEAPARYRTLPAEGGDFYWHKPAASKDANHRPGFGPVALTARLATWIAPNARAVSPLPATLATALALPTAPLDLPLVFSGGGLSEAQLTILPDFLRLDAKGGVTAFPAPLAKTWSFTLASGTGKFTGSFVVSDPGATSNAKATTRKVSFEGVLLQLASNETEGRLGEGFYLAPTKVKGGAGESGGIQILRVP